MRPLFAFASIAASVAPASVAIAAESQYAQLTIRQRVIVRIQTAPMTPAPPRIEWRERKGPKCVPMGAIQGAAVIAPGSVDLILRGGGRLRVRFSASCPALDYYSGFYIAPTADGMICSGRDSVRDRAGGECEITRFRELRPKR